MNKKIFMLILIFLFLVESAKAVEPVIQATFSVYPTTLTPGSDGYIQMTLRNTGNALANQVKISRVSSDAPIKISADWISELGSLNVGDTAISVFKFSVLNTASPGLYNVKFNIDYCQDSVCKTITPNVIINIQSPPNIQLLSISPSSFKPGERTNITFTITNIGNLPINNLVFIWSASNVLPVGYDNRVLISYLPPNSIYEIKREILVSPSATPGVYPVTIIFQYMDKSGINQTITSIAGIEVSGETDFEVSIQEISPSSLTLTIANMGMNPAYSVLVKIPKQEGFFVIGSSSNIVGNLNPGDYTFTTFQFISLPNITGTSRNLLVEIHYTDALGTRRILEKEVNIDEISRFTNRTVPTIPRSRVNSLTTNSTFYIIIGSIGIIMVIIILKFFIFKRFKSFKRK